MTIRMTLYTAVLTACAAITVSAQISETREPEPLAAVSVNPQVIQSVAASSHGPSLVAYCECGGLVSSTGNLYFTTFGINDGCSLHVSYGSLQKQTAAKGIGRLVGGLKAIVARASRP